MNQGFVATDVSRWICPPGPHDLILQRRGSGGHAIVATTLPGSCPPGSSAPNGRLSTGPGPHLLLALLLLLGTLRTAAQSGPAEVSSDAGPATPHFQEVLRLLRANLPGVTEAELNQGMVDGLLEEFGSRVQLVSTNPMPAETAASSSLRRVAVYPTQIAYFGVHSVGPGLAAEVTSALALIRQTNEVLGAVLDLRATAGWDYPAAAELADQFSEPGRLLMGWGEETYQSSQPPAFTGPLVVLVNRETGGAAEALAAALQQTGPTVVLGSPTAGRAFVMQSFPLETGQELRIAGSPVWVGDQHRLEGPIQPDLSTADQPALDRLWLEDPYYAAPGTNVGANAVRPRMDEAELVRQHRGLTNQPGPTGGDRPAVNATPTLQDPALAGALAVLQGLVRVRGGILR